MEPEQPKKQEDPLTEQERQQLLDLLKKINRNPKVKALLLKASESVPKPE